MRMDNFLDILKTISVALDAKKQGIIIMRAWMSILVYFVWTTRIIATDVLRRSFATNATSMDMQSTNVHKVRDSIAKIARENIRRDVAF